ncbi:MAG: GAF domain-containing protein, partial [Nocardioides sp.]|nr:GAF domain-containing protein [Nocardioides sp.]
DPSTNARTLLDAIISISSDLDLRSVLTRIVEAACELTGAQYAALGVIGHDGSLVEFVTTGIDDAQRARIGDLPRGRGVLGLIIKQPRALRLSVLSEHPQSVGFPANHPPMTTFLGVPVRIRGSVFGNLYLTEKTGGVEFTEQDEQLAEALASAAGFVIENARAYGLSERRRQWLEASARLADALQPPIDLEPALRLITQEARSLSKATATALLSYRYDAARTVTANPDDDERVEEALAELRADTDSGRDTTAVELETMTALVIPLRTHLTDRATLVALFETGLAPVDVEERELLVSFADQVAVALDRAQALADREELAVISDRDRIARDLHDVVIQRLFATGLQLQGAALLADSPDITERLTRAVTDLDQTIKDIRGTIFELEQHRLGSLRGELRALVREYVPVLGYTPVVRTGGPVDTAVPDQVREQLLPVLREALSNLARHARASYAAGGVPVTPAALQRCAHAEGGALPAARPERGLRNARRRAATLGGSLELERRKPQGTSFNWRVPLG